MAGVVDEQYEGCLSFFDVRGKVPRSHVIHVEHTTIDGTQKITIFERGVARLVAHEVDHLHGRLYTDLMREGSPRFPSSSTGALAQVGRIDVLSEIGTEHRGVALLCGWISPRGLASGLAARGSAGSEQQPNSANEVDDGRDVIRATPQGTA